MIYFYARVSADGWSGDAQVRQRRAAGVGHVFRGTASGGRTDRAQLRRVLGRLAAGDALMVARLEAIRRRDAGEPAGEWH